MRILIATDGSEFSRIAIDKACELLPLDKAAIRIVSAFEDSFTIGVQPVFLSAKYYQNVDDELCAGATGYLDDASGRIQKHFPEASLDVTTEVLRGYADHVIVEHAKAWKADLIVVGSHGYGFLGRLLGSVSNGVVHHAPCAVLVVRKTSFETHNGHSSAK